MPRRLFIAPGDLRDQLERGGELRWEENGKPALQRDRDKGSGRLETDGKDQMPSSQRPVDPRVNPFVLLTLPSLLRSFKDSQRRLVWIAGKPHTMHDKFIPLVLKSYGGLHKPIKI